MANFSIIGFDSAWTDNARAPGAICSIRISGGDKFEFIVPRLATFSEALDFIQAEKSNSQMCMVAIDQPTLVPNLVGMRPVERVVASLISYIGGGVQPANRSKSNMFGNTAPIWKFKDKLGAVEDPLLARYAHNGLHIIEVFPALALAAFDDRFCQRLSGPRYNPGRRKTFQFVDWISVLQAVIAEASNLGLDCLADWASEFRLVQKVHKSDQDKLDAAICSMIGFIWLFCDPKKSAMIGDLQAGYIVSPMSELTRIRLEFSAKNLNVPINYLHCQLMSSIQP